MPALSPCAGGVFLDPEPPQPTPRQLYPAAAAAAPAAESPRQGGLLAPLLARWRGQKVRLNEKAWADYAKEFQEV